VMNKRTEDAVMRDAATLDVPGDDGKAAAQAVVEATKRAP